MTWRKRIGVSVSVLVGMLIATGIIGWILHKSQPRFYRVYNWTPQQQSELDLESRKVLAGLHNLFASGEAAHKRALAATRAGKIPATDVVANEITVTFDEEKFNAFLINWSEIELWDTKYDAFVSGPGVFFDDGHLVFAATVKETGSVVSIHFAPSIDENGMLRMDLVKTLSGNLPVPRMAIDGQLAKVTSAIRRQLPKWETKAKIEVEGRANQNAAASGMSKLLLNAFDSKPSMPVLFFHLLDPMNPKDYAALKITAIQIKDEELTMTFRLLTPDEEAACLKMVQTPLEETGQ